MKARLSRDGTRVFCRNNAGTCSGEFGSVSEVPLPGRYDPAVTPILPTARLFRYPPGWVQRQNGVYELTSHAQKRVASGSASALRRGFAGGALGGWWHQLPRHPQLPATFRCPKCRWLNVIDADELGLDHPFHRVAGARVASPIAHVEGEGLEPFDEP